MKPRNVKWTQEEIDFLFRNPPKERGDYAKLAKKLGRSRNSIEQKASSLGVNFEAGQTQQSDSISYKNIAEERAYELSVVKAELEQLKKKGSAFKILQDNILAVIPTLPKYPSFTPSPYKLEKNNEEWVLVISDVQLGSKITSDETGGLGNYGFDIFKKRMSTLIQSVSDIQHYHTYVPKSLRIFFIGDIIDGSTIFKGQKRTLDLMTIDQITHGVNYFSDMVYQFAKMFPQVKCYGIPGNHGRVGEKGENWLGDNLDMLVYRWIKERLQDTKNVSFDISDSWYQLVYVNDWIFLLEHGDSFKGWAGIPFYGARRTKMNFQDLLQDFQIEFVDESMRQKHINLSEKFHYIVFGDKHVPAIFNNIIMNGCWPGGSELSLKYMQSAGMPQQWLFSVDKKYGVVWKRPVYLDTPKSSSRKLKLYA